MSFDPKERAAEKARSRAIDEERLMKGEISAIDLQRENCPMAAVLKRKRNVRVNLFPVCPLMFSAYSYGSSLDQQHSR